MGAKAIGMDNSEFKQMLRDDVWPEVSRKHRNIALMTHGKVSCYPFANVVVFNFSVSFESLQSSRKSGIK
jgi:hypothetical protein